MANVMTIDANNGVLVQEREKRIRYNVVLSGNYAQANRGQNIGEVLDLTKVAGANLADQFWGLKGPGRGYPIQGPAGYTVEVLPGADALHWLLKIWSAVGVELAAGAYPAAIAADLDFYVEFSGRSFD